MNEQEMNIKKEQALVLYMSPISVVFRIMGAPYLENLYCSWPLRRR